MAALMSTSRSQRGRVLDLDNVSVQLDTLIKAASVRQDPETSRAGVTCRGGQRLPVVVYSLSTTIARYE